MNKQIHAYADLGKEIVDGGWGPDVRKSQDEFLENSTAEQKLVSLAARQAELLADVDFSLASLRDEVEILNASSSPEADALLRLYQAAVAAPEQSPITSH